MTTILKLSAREILDSRGTPTIEVHLETAAGVFTASVPSGKSVGSREARELRDGGERFGGMGVTHAIQNVEGEIADALIGGPFIQETLDQALIALDGTPDKARLGANAILGVSLAFARAATREAGQPLYAYVAHLSGATPHIPRLYFNVLNGGAHADNGLPLQECMVTPRATSARESVEHASAVERSLGALLTERSLSTTVGDEGGFAPQLPDTRAALDLLTGAVERAHLPADLALDAAANYFYAEGVYRLDAHTSLSADELQEWYQDLVTSYPIISLEDPFEENAWDAFTALTEALRNRVHIVGDDLLATNPARIAEAAAKHAVTTALIKPNQIGTLSETVAAAKAARSGGLEIFASHRSGETTDHWIADVAVGLGAEHFKAGALMRGERVVKYNRIMEIEQELV